MNVRIAKELNVVPFEGEASEWDALVGGAEDATHSHLAAWRTVMADALGHRPRYWTAVDEDGVPRGVLPAVEVRAGVLGHYLLSMPFLNDGGPLGSIAARTALARHAVRAAGELGVDLLELRTRSHDLVELARSDRKVAVHLPLPATAEELWEKGFRAKLRSQIRRPMKEGMETRFGADQLPAFYEVFSRNMRDLGTPVLPRRFFEAVARAFPAEVIFAVVYHQGQPVASGCGFLWRGEFEITWASSLREFNRLSPNMLLYWSLMEQMIGRGARLFNFGRCTPGGSTHPFKLQWGGEDVPLPWAQWSPSGVASTPSADRAIFQVATAAWRRLPLPVANRIGPLLARRLP